MTITYTSANLNGNKLQVVGGGTGGQDYIVDLQNQTTGDKVSISGAINTNGTLLLCR